jgi:hypothetical protein
MHALHSSSYVTASTPTHNNQTHTTNLPVAGIHLAAAQNSADPPTPTAPHLPNRAPRPPASTSVGLHAPLQVQAVPPSIATHCAKHRTPDGVNLALLRRNPQKLIRGEFGVDYLVLESGVGYPSAGVGVSYPSACACACVWRVREMGFDMPVCVHVEATIATRDGEAERGRERKRRLRSRAALAWRWHNHETALGHKHAVQTHWRKPKAASTIGLGFRALGVGLWGLGIRAKV